MSTNTNTEITAMEEIVKDPIRLRETIINDPDFVNQKDSKGNTPLIYAVELNIPTIEILLRNGANIDDTNSEGQTPLMVATHQFKKEDILEYLISQGADVNIPDNKGNTPLMIIYIDNQYSKEKFYMLLSSEDIDLNHQNNKGETILSMISNNLADRDEWMLVADDLVFAGADVNIKDNEGKTALDYDVENGDSVSARILLDYGAIVSYPIPTDISPKMYELLKESYDQQSRRRVLHVSRALHGKYPGPEMLEHIAENVSEGLDPIERFQLVYAGMNTRPGQTIPLTEYTKDLRKKLGEHIVKYVREAPKFVDSYILDVFRENYRDIFNDTEIMKLIELGRENEDPIESTRRIVEHYPIRTYMRDEREDEDD